MSHNSRLGLVLSGGGARSAYQVGAVKALVEIAAGMGVSHPFPVLTGTSAGALNATYLAAHSQEIPLGVAALEKLWGDLSTGKVYNVGIFSMIKSSLRLIMELATADLSPEKTMRSLLDTTPLRALIQSEFQADAIEQNIRLGHLHSLAVKALSYSTGVSTTFFQSGEEINSWEYELRQGQKTQITVDHILASCAIPILFPPVKLGNEYYGDGSLRNYTPLGPAIKMGAERLVVVSVRRLGALTAPFGDNVAPSPARILGILLNTILLDSIELDYERLVSVNDILKELPADAKTPLRPVDVCMLAPSKDLGEMAVKEAHRLPRTIRYLIRGLGRTSEAADLISYLLFEPTYIRQLINLGYTDTMDKKESVKKVFLPTE